MMIGAIHSHPNGTPPSATDLIRAGHIRGYVGLEFSAIYIPSTGEYYVVSLLNTQKATAFSTNYASHVDPNTNWWAPTSEIGRYLSSSDPYRNFSGPEKQMYELADVLYRYDAGMVVYKIDSNGHAEGYGVEQKPGYTYTTPFRCIL